MARLDELWRSVDGPGSPPRLDGRRIKARVNAALDADQAERKIYMKQRLRAALAAAALTLALTGTAFAATANWDGLSAWFQGDTTPAQKYVDSTVRSVSDEDYTLTVEGCAADESTVFFTLTVTALSDEAKEFIHDDNFNSIDFLSTGVSPDAPPDEDYEGEVAVVANSCGYRELDAPGEYSRRFAADVSNIPAYAETLWVRCGYMAEGKGVEVPITPAPSVTVKVNAAGPGALDFSPFSTSDSDVLTIDKITISPFTCRIEYQGPNGVQPNIRFRMADGSIYTWSQMIDINDRFKEIQNLDNITSVIVFDMEYPLDGSKPTPVEHDPALDPFTVTRMEPLGEGGGSIPVRELTEKLGGACTWDAATGDVSCTYRDVTIVLRAERDTAQVNGKTVELRSAPAMQNGILAADWSVFQDAWGIDGFIQRETIWNAEDPDSTIINWFDWYIIP